MVGTVGGGGAILALPVLVYVLGQPVGPASTAALIVVAVAAGAGASALAREGRMDWRIAVSFSVPAAAGSAGGAIASRSVDPKVLILAFVPLMLGAAGATWHRAGCPPGDDERPVQAGRPEIWLTGLAVGLLTGFFGVGGGFIIVPILTVRFGMGFHRAIATSLVIIGLTGIAGLLSHLAAGARLDLPITVGLAGPTALGALVGARIGRDLPQRRLGRAFAILVWSVAAYLLIDVAALGGPPA